MWHVALASLVIGILPQCKRTVVIVPPVAYQDSAYGGHANLQQIKDSGTVTACLLDPPPNTDPNFPYKSHPETCREKGGIVLSPARVDELKSIFSDPETCPEDVDMMCMPDYGVRFTFGSGEEAIAINLCFHCGQLATYRKSECLGQGNFRRPARLWPGWPRSSKASSRSPEIAKLDEKL